MSVALAEFQYKAEWLLQEKVDFDGINKYIRVYSHVTSLDLRSELYSAWIRWLPLQDNTKFLPAMKYSGFDQIPGGETGGVFFLINGWKLIVSIESVTINGILYSEDYPTPYFNQALTPVFPAQVSSYVHSQISYQNVVTGSPIEIAALSANNVVNHSKTLTLNKYLALK